MASARVSSPPLTVYLPPGEYFVGHARHRVRTLLGSCVSITLWSRRRRIGAMSHFLLAERCPARAGLPAPLPPVPDARYGREALALMLEGLAAHGIEPGELEAKLFGGGHMFPDHVPAGLAGVGRRNGDAALDMLHACGIPVLSCSLFGTGHRSIVFDIATGEVWARQAGSSGPAADSPHVPRHLPGARPALRATLESE